MIIDIRDDPSHLDPDAIAAVLREVAAALEVPLAEVLEMPWGSLISSVFGLLFVEINAGQLPARVGLTVRLLGAVAFLGLLGLMVRARRTSDDLIVATQQQPDIRRRFWIVVAAEVVVGVAGLVVINGPLDVPNATVGWITLIAGLHFFGLATVWRQPFLHGLGAAITVCGVAGIALVAAGASTAISATIAGVVPGGLLLIAGWWSVPGHPRGHDLWAPRT